MDNGKNIVALAIQANTRSDRLSALVKLSRNLDDLGTGMLMEAARQLFVDSLLRAMGLPVHTSNALDIAKFLDDRALLDLITKAQGIAQERSRGVKHAKIVSFNPDVPVHTSGLR